MIFKEVSKLFIETIPPTMHLLRGYVRNSSNPCLSVPQFRVLANINRGLNQISKIAEHHGISQPGMSKLVEGLVAKKLIKKNVCKEDKRITLLCLTQKGEMAFRKIKEEAVEKLSEDFQSLNEQELNKLSESLIVLNQMMKQLKEKS